MVHTELPLVSILFVTWNRCEYLLRAIRSALQQDYTNIEIVLVDNCSTDGTVVKVSDAFPCVKIVQLHRNLGCPSARNIGIANCSGTYVYLMDDDGWFVDESAIGKCVAVAEQHLSLHAVCSRIHNIDDNTWYPSISEDSVVQQFHGTCVLLRKKEFLDIGGFPDDFFFIGEEEYSSLRLIDSGGSVAVVADSVLKHENRRTVGKPLGQFPYYSIRNTNRTALRLYPFPYSYLRVLKNAVHCIRFAFVGHQPALPWRVICSLISDILAPCFPRTPISKSAYRKYKGLSTAPPLRDYFDEKCDKYRDKPVSPHRF